MTRKGCQMARKTIVSSQAVEFLPVGGEGDQFVYTSYKDGRVQRLLVFPRKTLEGFRDQLENKEVQISKRDQGTGDVEKNLELLRIHNSAEIALHEATKNLHEAFPSLIETVEVRGESTCDGVMVISFPVKSINDISTSIKGVLDGPRGVDKSFRKLSKREVMFFEKLVEKNWARGAVAWKTIPPKGVPITEHNLSFVDTLIQAKNMMKVDQEPLLLVVSRKVANIIESLPGYAPKDRCLCGRWEVHISDDIKEIDTAGVFYMVCEDTEDAVSGCVTFEGYYSE